MKIQKTKLKGEYIIIPEKVKDERGFFSRVFDVKEFAELGLNFDWVQGNTFFSKKKGTLRGLVYQENPKEEVKLIRCTRSAIYDVALDVRQDSESFGEFSGVVLSAENGKMHYIPEGFAHGYITMADDTEVYYQVSEYYSPDHAVGVRWNDRQFKINWPLEPKVISEKDSNYTNYKKK